MAANYNIDEEDDIGYDDMEDCGMNNEFSSMMCSMDDDDGETAFNQHMSRMAEDD